jgi:selenocysteine-specific elongation factor
MSSAARRATAFMTNIIVGTAGHIDHGKTALIRALTGIETDRFEEEKRRGISIDLGFAHLELGGVRLGFIDVPGHERFVRNMLAGAGGIDLVLFVIGADESIKPQTREHFDICRLLGIRRGILVLTKADLVDRDILDLVRLEAEEFVAGSFLEGAPVVAVSAKTGEGIEELKVLLAAEARAATAKSGTGHFRLPIDRSFAMKGFGTVVTGTLISGSVAVEQEVEIAERSLRLRVRGLQVHGAAAKRALAGQRTAINLAGIEATDLERGLTAIEPGRLRTWSAFDCEVELLASARPLKHRAPVHFHAWTAETEAEVKLLGDRPTLEPGTRAFARLHVKTPLLLLPGDRFIIRQFSPVLTIGGGRVIGFPTETRKLRRKDLAARVAELSSAPSTRRIEMAVGDAPFGLDMAGVIRHTGLTETAIETAAAVADSPLLLLTAPTKWLLNREWIAARLERLHTAVAAYHRDRPLQPGLPKEHFRTKELAGAPEFLIDALLKQSATVIAEGEALRLKSHRLHLKQDEEEAFARIVGAFERAGLAVPSPAEVLTASGVDPVRARTLLQILFRQKRLIRISEDLIYHPAAIDALRAILASHRGENFAVPAFKEWTGVSRKYAIPLLEFLDRERITRREGDLRVVL